MKAMKLPKTLRTFWGVIVLPLYFTFGATPWCGPLVNTTKIVTFKK